MDSITQDVDYDSSPPTDNSDDAGEQVLSAGLYPLGLSKSYVPSWTRRDAFRELYQNWCVLTARETRMLTFTGKMR